MLEFFVLRILPIITVHFQSRGRVENAVEELPITEKIPRNFLNVDLAKTDPLVPKQTRPGKPRTSLTYFVLTYSNITNTTKQHISAVTPLTYQSQSWLQIHALACPFSRNNPSATHPPRRRNPGNSSTSTPNSRNCRLHLQTWRALLGSRLCKRTMSGFWGVFVVGCEYWGCGWNCMVGLMGV